MLIFVSYLVPSLIEMETAKPASTNSQSDRTEKQVPFYRKELKELMNTNAAPSTNEAQRSILPPAAFSPTPSETAMSAPTLRTSFSYA